MIPIEVHLFLNHAPIIGLIFGLVFFLGGLRRPSDAALRAGLRIFLATGIAALVVAASGFASAKALASAAWLAPDALERHRASGILALAAVVALGALSGAVLRISSTRTIPGWARNAALLLAMSGLACTSWAGYLGGSLRHSELGRGRAQVCDEAHVSSAAASSATTACSRSSPRKTGSPRTTSSTS